MSDLEILFTESSWYFSEISILLINANLASNDISVFRSVLTRRAYVASCARVSRLSSLGRIFFITESIFFVNSV